MTTTSIYRTTVPTYHLRLRSTAVNLEREEGNKAAMQSGKEICVLYTRLSKKCDQEFNLESLRAPAFLDFGFLNERCN